MDSAGRGPQVLDAAFDREAFLALVERGVEHTPAQAEKLAGSLPGSVLGALVRPESSFHLVGYHEQPPRLLFRRVRYEDLGWSYVELHLAERDGALRIVDASVSGSPISLQCKRQFQAMVGGGGMSDAFFEIGQLYRQGQFKAVLAAWERLRPEERELEELLALRGERRGAGRALRRRRARGLQRRGV